MRKNFGYLFVWLMLSVGCLGQNNTALTGTITDSDGQVWGNAGWTAQLQIPGGGGTARFISGGVVPRTNNGFFDVSGVILAGETLPNNAQILPTGTSWKICIASVTSAPQQCFVFAVTGSTFNFGTKLSTMITAPRIQAATTVYAYNATEVINAVQGTGFINTITGVCSLFTGAGYAACGGGSGGGSPSAPAQSIQLADSAVTGLKSDANILVDTTQHQTQIVGIGSRRMTVTNPTANQADFSANIFNDKRIDERDSERNTIFGGPGGMNYGNGPNVTRSLWTTSGANFWNFNFNRRGITQKHSGTLFKRATGDYAWDYANQVFGVGGITGTSDEGGVGSKLIGGEFGNWYTGTATAGATTGSTILPVTTGVQTCDGCFVYDASKAGPTGHFTAAPIFVTVGSTGYWSEAIDTPVTPSTAFGVPVCNLPQLVDQTVAQTVACTVTGALGSTGVFTNGIASLSGPYAEQVSITVTAPSSGTQTVNITYRNPHSSGAFMLWQGGSVQGTLQVLPFFTSVSGMANGQTVFGAPDSTHLAAGVAFGGSQAQPTTNFSGLVPIITLTKVGSVATATFSGTTAIYVPFDNLASAVISGTASCTGGSMDGTATNVTVNFSAATISWTDATSSTGCASGNISLPISNFAYQLFPYAEQIASGDNLLQIVLEPNQVAWANGDSIVEPHPPTFDYNSRWDDVRIFNPNALASSTGIFQTYAGAGINGAFNFIRLFNQNACSMYQGCGGSLTLAPWLRLDGPNAGTISSTIPVDGSKFAMKFDCPFSGGITCNDVEHVISMPLGSIDLDPVIGWHLFQPIVSPSGTFALGITSTSMTNDGTGTTIKTQLSTSGGTALRLQGQFNNGGPMADIQWFDFTDSRETGRISSSLAFGNIINFTQSVGTIPFITATNTGGTVAVNIQGALTNNNVPILTSAGERGTTALTAGAVTVSSTTIGSTAVVLLTNCVTGGTPGLLSVGTRVANTSFVINSSSAADTSSVCWFIPK